jgi:predicted Zn-dependent protease
LILVAVVATPTSSRAVDLETIDEMIIGYGLKDLPDNPDLSMQIAAGDTEVDIDRQIDPAFDADTDTVVYLTSVEAKLLAASNAQPPYPIHIHTSRWPITNAESLPGGQIVVYEKLFENLDDESQLAGVLAHESAHQLHDDFLKFWHAYKTNRPLYGTDGVLHESEEIDAIADATGIRLMYAAGWDPQERLSYSVSNYRQGVMKRRGEPEFWSSHPRERERMQAMKEIIAQLPPKDGLVKDTPEFQKIKAKY